MADQVTKKTLLNVEINSSEAINNIAELKKQVSELRTKQKELDTSTDQGRQQYEAYGQQIKALNTASQSYQKEIQNQVKAQNEQEGSIQKLKAQLSLQTAEYNKLSAAQREAADGKALQASINATSEELKELEGSLGNNTRNVGDYKNQIIAAVKELTDLRDATAEMKKEQKQLEATNQKGTDEYKVLSKAIEENEGKIKSLESSNGGLTKSLSDLPGPAGNVIKSMEGVGKTMYSLAANPLGAVILLIVVAVTALYNIFKDFDPLIDKIEQGFAALKAVTSVLKDSVLSLITGQKSLTETTKGLGGAMADAAKEAIALKKAQQDLDDMNLKNIVSSAKAKRQIDELILQSKDRTKTEAERIALIDQALKIEEDAYKERKAIADREVMLAQGAITSSKNLTAEQKRLLKEKGVDYAISLKETKAVTDDEIKTLAEALAKQETVLNESVSLREKAINRQNALLDKEKENQEKAAQKAVEASAKKQAAEEKRLAALEKAHDKEIKLDTDILALKVANQGKIDELRLTDESYFQSRLSMIESNAESEKAIIQKQLSFKKISEQEAATAIIAIENSKKEATESLSSKKLDLVIANLEYETEMALLQQEEQVANKQRSDEELHLSELLRIENDRQAQEKALQLRLAAEPAKEAEIKKQIALVNQKARTETAKEDATFEANQAQLKLATKQTNLSNEFELAKGNLNKEHELKLQQLDLDRQAEIDSAKKTGADVALINEKYAKIEQDLAAETRQKKIENVLEYARAAQDGLSALNDLLSALGERELKAATEKNASKKNDLDKQLKAGLISQQEHDYQVALSAYELDKKTDKINREAAIRDKALKATQTIINTAAAVVSMLALGPAGIPLSIAAGVTGALQLAAILATPLPSSTAGTAPKFSDFAATGSGSDSGTSSSDKESEAAQKALDKAAEDAKKAAEKAQSEYEKAKESAEKAIQDAKDLADKIAQEEKDRADKAIMDAWEKSDAAIAEASKRADDISAKAQQALANALSALEKAQNAVLDIQAKIDKKASDKISEEEKKRIEAIEAAEKEILDAKNEADKVVEDAQKSADKAKENASEKELAYLELLQQAQDSNKNAEELQRAADIALSNSQSQSGMLWYQPELKAALRKQAEDAQKAADKAKEDAEKKAEKLEEARIAAENARISAETAEKALESALLSQSSASEAAKQASLAAEERAKQAAEAAQRASDEEDARWQRELEAAKQAEIEAQAAVEQAKADAEAAKKEAELAAQKKLEAELAAEERKAAYDAAQEEKRRIANEEAQAKADKTALEAQEAANNAAKAAALAAEAAALAAAAAGWTVAGTITPTDNTIIDNIDFNKNFGFNSDFKFKDASGYQSRTNNESNNLSKKDIQDAMTSAVKELKIYTTIEDIRKQDQNYTIIESRGTV